MKKKNLAKAREIDREINTNRRILEILLGDSAITIRPKTGYVEFVGNDSENVLFPKFVKAVKKRLVRHAKDSIKVLKKELKDLGKKKKNYLPLILLFFFSGISAQQAYLAPSAGAYLNTDIKTPLEMIGYGVEAGYCFESNFCVGGSVGSLNLSHTAPFIQARTGYTFLERKHFSLSLGAGLGYVFIVNQLIGEGDLTANIHMKPNWDFTFTFANQGVYSIGYLPAINVGFVKYFDVKKKQKKSDAQLQ